MTATDISQLELEVLSCVFSSPARPAGSAPPSSPSSSAPATRSSAWPARTPRPPRSPPPAPRSTAASLDDLDGLRAAAAASDGVIHLAFKHDIAFSGDFQGADRRRPPRHRGVRRGARGLRSAVRHRRPGCSGSPRAAWRPSRTGTRRPGGGDPAGTGQRRADARPSPSRGVRSSVVRLPPTVHGDGDNGFVATLVAIARDKGVSGYIGDGANRWPAVHRPRRRPPVPPGAGVGAGRIDAARRRPTRACRSATSPR